MILADEYDNYFEIHFNDKKEIEISINDKEKVFLDKQTAEYMIDILIHVIPKKQRRRKMKQILKWSYKADKIKRELADKLADKERL